MIDLLCIVFVKEGKSPWCSGASSKECWTYTRQLAREEVSSVFFNNLVMPNKSASIYPPEFDWWPNNQGRSVVFMVMEFNSKSTFCHRCHVLTAICSYVTKAVRNILKPLFFFQRDWHKFTSQSSSAEETIPSTGVWKYCILPLPFLLHLWMFIYY